MPSPRPPDLDAQGRPVTAAKPPDLDASGNPEVEHAVAVASAPKPKPRPDVTHADLAPSGELSEREVAEATWRPYADAIQGLKANLITKPIHGGADLLRSVFGYAPTSGTPENQAAMRVPDSATGKLGGLIGDAVAFGVPGAKVSRAVQGRGLLTRAAADGATAAGVAGLQSGGDGSQMALMGGMGAAAPVVGAGVKAGVKAGVGLVRQAAAGAQEGGVGGAVASLIRTAAPVEPKKMLVQGFKPRATATNFEAQLDRAVPELKATEQQLGRPIGGNDDVLEAAKIAKKRVWGQYEQIAGPMRDMGATVDLSEVADGIVKSIPKKLRLENPQAAARLEELANVYRKRFSLEDAERLLVETNAELEAFYHKYPGAKQAALAADPEVAHTVATAEGLRSSIYRTLDGAGESGAAQELKRRYGALLSVEEEAFRRSNVAKRQQPESLSEQIGKVRAASDIARGLFKMARGQFISGGADIVAARAGRDTAKFLKEQQTSDALIRRAFEAFEGAPVPVPIPQQPRISGLLGRGARPMPGAADASGRVRDLPIPVTHTTTPTRLLGRGQPAPPPPQNSGRIFNMPGDVQAPKPDPSGGGSIKAAPIAHEINPTVPAKQGVRVSQYAGDPDAKPVPVVDRDDVRTMLGTMLRDLQTLSPERGRLVRMGNESVFARGGGGSAVADDIRKISEQNVANAKVMEAIDDLLAGKRPTNRLHTAALDAALGYLEKRPGYKGPVVGDIPEAADDGFEAFSRSVDDVGDTADESIDAIAQREVDPSELPEVESDAVTAAVRKMAAVRAKAPRPLKKMYGKNPTPEQIANHSRLSREWSKKYRAARQEWMAARGLE